MPTSPTLVYRPIASSVRGRDLAQAGCIDPGLIPFWLSPRQLVESGIDLVPALKCLQNVKRGLDDGVLVALIDQRQHKIPSSLVI